MLDLAGRRKHSKIAGLIYIISEDLAAVGGRENLSEPDLMGPLKAGLRQMSSGQGECDDRTD